MKDHPPPARLRALPLVLGWALVLGFFACLAWIKAPPQKKPVVASLDAATFYGARVGPIFNSHCVVCHNADKRKGGLQLDSFAGLLRGGDDGPVVNPGAPKDSEIFRRTTLPPDDDDFMPSGGKPPLSADEVKVIELWIAAGASPTTPVAGIAGAPALPAPAPPLAPDYRPFLGRIEALASSLGVQLVPRSKVPTDGLALRTFSAPERFGDAALASLSPVAPLIVEAELARTKVTDSGLRSLGAFANLRTLDLSHTSVTTAGVAALAPLAKLESVNLTGTAVDGSAFASPNFHAKPERLYLDIQR